MDTVDQRTRKYVVKAVWRRRLIHPTYFCPQCFGRVQNGYRDEDPSKELYDSSCIGAVITMHNIQASKLSIKR